LKKTGRGFGVPSWIGLPSWWSKAAIDTKKYYLTHELGHIWDAHTGHLGAEITAHDEHLHYRAYGIVGGVADELNTFIISHEGGTNFIEGTTDSRFYNPNDPSYVDPHIPTNYQWASTKWSNKYGNGATADYLAESFAYSIYDKNGIPGGSNGPVAKWIDARIYVESLTLPNLSH
jgi:hypothetical protein